MEKKRGCIGQTLFILGMTLSCIICLASLICMISGLFLLSPKAVVCFLTAFLVAFPVFDILIKKIQGPLGKILFSRVLRNSIAIVLFFIGGFTLAQHADSEPDIPTPYEPTITATSHSITSPENTVVTATQETTSTTSCNPSFTPSPVQTVVSTPSPTLTPTPTPQPTATPSPTPKPTATLTPKPTATPTLIPTTTPTSKPMATPQSNVDTSKITVTFKTDYIKGNQLYLKVYTKNNSESIFSGYLYVSFYTSDETKRLGSDTIIVEKLYPGTESWANISVDRYTATPKMKVDFSEVSFTPIEAITSDIDTKATENTKSDFYWSFFDANWYGDVTEIVVYNDGTCVVTIKDNAKENGQLYAASVWSCGNDYGIKSVQVKDSSGAILAVFTK